MEGKTIYFIYEVHDIENSPNISIIFLFSQTVLLFTKRKQKSLFLQF